MTTPSRFDAETVQCLASVNDRRRVEIQFSDGEGTHVVSLPLAVAIDLGHLICDLSEKAPFLLGVQRFSPRLPDRPKAG